MCSSGHGGAVCPTSAVASTSVLADHARELPSAPTCPTNCVRNRRLHSQFGRRAGVIKKEKEGWSTTTRRPSAYALICLCTADAISS